jgi:transcriptional regulator, putative
LPSHDSLYIYLLSFLDGVEILEPPRLREEFKEKLKAIADIYKS